MGEVFVNMFQKIFFCQKMAGEKEKGAVMPPCVRLYAPSTVRCGINL